MKIKIVDENLGEQPGLSMFIPPEHPFERDIEDPDAVVFTDHMCFNLADDHNYKKIAWIIEPPIINGDHHIKMADESNYSQYDYVCTYNRWLEDRIPNFKFVPHGGTWLRSKDIGMHEKTKLCSMIYSEKQWNVSHSQRSGVHEMLKGPEFDVNFYGSGCQHPIEFKITGLQDYMFSIAMENESSPYLFSPGTDYFSEKIIDCLLTGCIPIYNGNSTIVNYFNPDGIMLFSDPGQILSIVESLTPELYASKAQAMQENFEIAKTFMHPTDSIRKILENGK